MLQTFLKVCQLDAELRSKRLLSTSILETYDRPRFEPDAKLVSTVQYLGHELTQNSRTWYTVSKVTNDFTGANKVTTTHVLNKNIANENDMNAIIAGHEADTQGVYHGDIMHKNLKVDDDYRSLPRPAAAPRGRLAFITRLIGA
jgi:hypothetical protein